MLKKTIRIIFLTLILIFLLLIIFLIFPFGVKKEGKEKEILVKKPKELSFPFYNFYPQRNIKIPPPNLGEKAGIAIFFPESGGRRILYRKNITKKMAFASLTKLMTAMVASDIYSPQKMVTVSRSAVATLGESGRLSPGEKISVEGLLSLALLVSSNDASTALAEILGYKKFVNLMNKKAKEIGLLNTHFENPHGLDEKGHFSTPLDLALMTRYSIIHYKKIWKILATKEKDIISYDYLGRQIIHHAKNTNKLLTKEGIIGGKTGYTEEAGDAMILACNPPGKAKGKIIIVLLGLPFGERLKKSYELYLWIKKAYFW